MVKSSLLESFALGASVRVRPTTPNTPDCRPFFADPMESMFSSLSSMLPYFSSLSMINYGDTCATKRLLQCRWMGLYSCDMTPKLIKDVDLYEDPDARRLQLAKLNAAKLVKEAVRKARGDKADGWTPILHMWEVVEGYATIANELAHLVFADATMTRFILVDFGVSPCPKVEEGTCKRANVLYSLLKYLGARRGCSALGPPRTLPRGSICRVRGQVRGAHGPVLGGKQAAIRPRRPPG